MKFQDMKYERIDMEEAFRKLDAFTKRMKDAKSFAEAKEIFEEKDRLDRHISTQLTLCSIRFAIDTRDAFYDAEETFYNEMRPHLEEHEEAFSDALLNSPFRKELEETFGKVVFINAEMDKKVFSPEIIEDLQKESDLKQAYNKLLASAAIPFDGKTYTISQLTPFKTHTDDAVRLRAWQAEGAWYNEHKEQLDSLFDELVKVRDTMAKKLHFDNYVTAGYYRMTRNCYTKEDVEKFRAFVIKYLVPVADQCYQAQAKRIGIPYPMNYADNALKFRDGNPKPAGNEEEILKAGIRFYDSLSKEAGAFFRMMNEQDLLHVYSTEGKRPGGFMDTLPEYQVPFIFANFNGTQGDVEVITHEAGHAFAGYLNMGRVPESTIMPTFEACEVHSMSMEFFGERASEDFFGADALKYRYSHLEGAVTFIPYGTMVDHFQHIVYENPSMTPAERHAEWKKLTKLYMPWVKLDDTIPFYGDGAAWQRQIHIYIHPFYYIDYCLAQTVSLQFYSLIREDFDNAWEKYMAYTVQGGSDTFTAMLKKAGLNTPFEEESIRKICADASLALKEMNL